MARAIANVEQLRQDGGFDAWMYGILRHVVIDSQRRLFREQPGSVPDAVDGGPQPADQALVSEDAAEVRAAFEQLRRADQELLELRIVAQLSVEEVAAALGRRPGAVRMAQSRALARLRAILSENELEWSSARAARTTRA